MQVNFLKKKYQEKLENAYLTVKSATASGALSGSRTPALQTNVSPSKPKNQVVKVSPGHSLRGMGMRPHTMGTRPCAHAV